MTVPTDLFSHGLNRLRGHRPKTQTGDHLRGSAILIPVVKRERDQLLFTLRCRSLRHHPGQISFPGGRIEPGEQPLEAAIREAEEEIGLPADKVEILGQLDDVISPRGFHIQCYVGWVEPFEVKLNTDEVAQLITADLDELFDRGLHSIKKWDRDRDVHYFDFRNGLVWGVTGKITYLLREAIAENPAGAPSESSA